MILARFSRSASASRAIARFMLSGNWMSLSSTRVTSTPHSTVVVSRISRILPLITEVSASTSSSECCPNDVAQRGLGDLIDRRVNVFDGDHGLSRVHHPEIGHRGDADTDVVTGDDA